MSRLPRSRSSASFWPAAMASQSFRGRGFPPGRKPRARRTATERAVADGANSSASPSSTAVYPSTGSPLAQISAALAGPTRRGSRCIPPYPGMMPSLTSGWPRLAFSVTIR